MFYSIKMTLNRIPVHWRTPRQSRGVDSPVRFTEDGIWWNLMVCSLWSVFALSQLIYIWTRQAAASAPILKHGLVSASRPSTIILLWLASFKRGTPGLVPQNSKFGPFEGWWKAAFSSGERRFTHIFTPGDLLLFFTWNHQI